MPLRDGEERVFRNQYAIVLRILSWLGAFFGLSWILRYTAIYWIFATVGFLSCLCIFFYCLVSDTPIKEETGYSRSRRFNFVNTKDWENEVDNLFLDGKKLDEPIIEESFLISETLDDLVNLIVKEFIDKWFDQISQSTIFQDSIRQELRQVIRNIKERMAVIDFASLLVFHIIPIVNEHFIQFSKAVGDNGLYDNAVAIARKYDRGRIHPGVTISVDSNNINEKKHLRSKVEAFLPYLISSKENTNQTGIFLLRELLTCTILSKVVQLLGDSDFYNVLVVNLVGDNLKHREQVKQLRAALAEHTRQVNPEISRSLNRSSRNVMIYKKAVLNSIAHKNFESNLFNSALNNIFKTKTVVELQEMLSYTELLLLNIQNDKSNEGIVLLSKLDLLKLRINDKILQLSETNKTLDVEDTDNLELSDILYNSTGFNYFAEFMESRNRSVWLELWLAIDSIKAPLEDLDVGDDGKARLSLSLEFSSLEDVAEIYDEFFHMPILEIDQETVDVIEEYVLNNSPIHKLELYHKARKALFKFQDKIYDSININDFSQFKKSELFVKLQEARALDSTNDETHAHMPYPIRPTSNLKDTNEIIDLSPEREVDKVSPTVIKAVEQAFSKIMHNVDGNKSDLSKGSNINTFLLAEESESQPYNPVLTIHLKRDLFGESSNLFNDDIFDYSNTNRNSKLFDDDSDQSISDTDSVNFDSDTQIPEVGFLNSSRLDLQIFLAAPGNLRLAEEISKLSEEIENLSEQQAILSPLLNKAELTNNISELKILRKSKAGLDREINAKELQKQQFIVQESDNSLYGKSRVNIQSYISGNENGRNFILYIVEVQKISNDSLNNVTAGWIVARRFRQFFKLHEYLKSRYPKVNNLKFPKRTVLVLKFQHKQIVEQRKMLLEEYLQELIKIPDVCSNKVFRSFLSSENFNLRAGQPLDGATNANLRKLKLGVEVVANKLYSGISGKIVLMPSTKMIDPIPGNAVDQYLKDMQKELKQFDEAEQSTTDKPVFVKPICDLLISIFRLSTSNSWLRGRALLVILHQVFGNTLEKKVYEIMEFYLRTEESILDLAIWVKTTLFPMGKFMEAPKVRNSYQRSTTRQEAKVLLNVFMQETCSKIFGISNTTYAHNMVFEMLQNDFLNRHLILQIFDELVNQMFPETVSGVCK